METPIFSRVMEILKQDLTKDEWIELGEVLDNGSDFLEPVNEYLAEIAPEVFTDFECSLETDE